MGWGEGTNESIQCPFKGGGGYNVEIGNVRQVTVIQTVVGIYIEKVLGIRPFAIHQMKHVTFKNMTYLDGLPTVAFLASGTCQ